MSIRLDMNDLMRVRSLVPDVGTFSDTLRQYKELLRGGAPLPYQGEVAFRDIEGAEKPFAPHYEQHIKPLVQEFEERRVGALIKVRSLSFKVLPIACLALLGVIAGIIGLGLELMHAGILSLFIIVGAGGIISIPVTKYKSNVKGIIFPKIFSFFGDFTYDQKGLGSVRSLKSSGIIPSYDRESTEDYVRGEYEGVSIELTEAHLEDKHRDSKGRTSYSTVFKGIFVRLSMHKNFKGKTIIKRDSGGIGNWLTDKTNALENVKLEDPVFEKQFEVYSSDQIEARYLLTTSFMERLLKLSSTFGDDEIAGINIPKSFRERRGLQASFYDDKLLIMIPTQKDRFEPASIFIPATFEAEINIVLGEMNQIFQIVHMLKLNQDIGL